MKKFRNQIIKLSNLFNDKKIRNWVTIPLIVLAISSYFVGALLFQVSQDYNNLDPFVLAPTIFGLLGSSIIIIALSFYSIIKLKTGDFVSTLLLLITIIISSIICLIAIILGPIGYLKYN